MTGTTTLQTTLVEDDFTSKLEYHTFNFESSTRNRFHERDFELDTNFKLYRAVVYVYLVLFGFLFCRSALQYYSGLNRLIPLTVYGISFIIWFYGNIAITNRSSGSQKVFMGLLILFMICHAVTCGRIILDSYVIMPSTTFSSFGLNAIFGIFVPVAVYFEADKLRQTFSLLKS